MKNKVFYDLLNKTKLFLIKMHYVNALAPQKCWSITLLTSYIFQNLRLSGSILYINKKCRHFIWRIRIVC